MKGFIEVKEDSYEDTLEHLHRIKMLTCKLIKMLQSSSELYNDDEDDEDDEQYEPKSRTKSGRGRYGY